MNEPVFPQIADPQVFSEAIFYTEGLTGFPAALVEKDYYCSLILRYFFESIPNDNTGLVFKGGTCLGKVYSDFYRLSEDLDFVISIPVSSKRTERKHAIEETRVRFEALPESLPGMDTGGDFTGHNESRQYIGTITYPSVVFHENPGQIKFEVSLREELLTEPEMLPTRTIAVNPFTRKELIAAFNSRTISFIEAIAEKTRAALTRKEPAIRDFYDLHYAKIRRNFDFFSDQFLNLVERKTSIPGNSNIDVSEDRKIALEKQLESQLRTVLRRSDYDIFNLEEAFSVVQSIAERIQGRSISSPGSTSISWTRGRASGRSTIS